PANLEQQLNLLPKACPGDLAQGRATAASVAVAVAILAILLLATNAAEPVADDASVDEQIIRMLNLTNGGYVKGASPRPINGTAVVVTIMIEIVKLIDVDMVKQFIVLENRVSMTPTSLERKSPDRNWPQLAPSTRLLDWLWTPDISVSQPLMLEISQPTIRSKLLAEISSDGQGATKPGISLNTKKCNMQLASFPFDKQQCNFSMASGQRPPNSLRLRVVRSIAIDLSIRFLRSNEYCVTAVDSNSEMETADVLRHSAHHPSALILATCIFGFLLPSGLGRPTALNVAILLSMSVFLQLRAASLLLRASLFQCSVSPSVWLLIVCSAVLCCAVLCAAVLVLLLSVLCCVLCLYVLLCCAGCAVLCCAVLCCAMSSYTESSLSLPIPSLVLLTVAMAVTALSTNRQHSCAPVLQESCIAGGCEQPSAEAAVPQPPADDDSAWADQVGKQTSVAPATTSMETAEWRQIGRIIDRLLAFGAIVASAGILICLALTAAGSGDCEPALRKIRFSEF
uniref:Neur_chan_LBD domain-containing protein n=1 Tax=Macrostomum lignano TaxID=282301 RepID=A0A1I8F2I5_9PLAT